MAEELLSGTGETSPSDLKIAHKTIPLPKREDEGGEKDEEETDLISTISIYQFSGEDELVEAGHLEMHDMTAGGDALTLFFCEFCDKRFSTLGNLNQHQDTHLQDKPYMCSYCGKKFSRKSYARAHEDFHNNSSRYKCEICGKLFMHCSALTTHKRSHTGEKPYICKFCGKGFTQGSSLRQHEIMHTGNRLYQCRFCEKRLLNSSNLVRHERTHTGEKPFQCEVCRRSFREKGTLQRHMWTHTGDKPFRCDICDRSFTTSSAKLRHQSNHVNDSLKPSTDNQHADQKSDRADVNVELPQEISAHQVLEALSAANLLSGEKDQEGVHSLSLDSGAEIHIYRTIDLPGNTVITYQGANGVQTQYLVEIEHAGEQEAAIVDESALQNVQVVEMKQDEETQAAAKSVQVEHSTDQSDQTCDAETPLQIVDENNHEQIAEKQFQKSGEDVHIYHDTIESIAAADVTVE